MPKVIQNNNQTLSNNVSNSNSTNDINNNNINNQSSNYSSDNNSSFYSNSINSSSLTNVSNPVSSSHSVLSSVFARLVSLLSSFILVLRHGLKKIKEFLGLFPYLRTLFPWRSSTEYAAPGRTP